MMVNHHSLYSVYAYSIPYSMPVRILCPYDRFMSHIIMRVIADSRAPPVKEAVYQGSFRLVVVM